MSYNFIIDKTTQTYGLPYDFDSVMHSEDDAWSSNGRRTIQTLDSSKQGRIGQAKGASPGGYPNGEESLQMF